MSNAGGFGVFRGDHLAPEQVSRRVERTGELTDRPFGINFIIAELEYPDTPEEDGDAEATLAPAPTA